MILRPEIKMENQDNNNNNPNNNIETASKLFGSSDSVAAVFKSADFLKSLDAYYAESLANTTTTDAPSSTDNNNNKAVHDASNLFRSVELLKSLDALPSNKSRSNSVDYYTNYLKSFDFLKSLDSVSAAPTTTTTTPSAAAVANAGKLMTSRDWMAKYEPGHVDVAYDLSLFKSAEPAVSSSSAVVVPSSLQRTTSNTSSRWMKIYEEGIMGAAAAKKTSSTAAATTATVAITPYRRESMLWNSTELAEPAAASAIAVEAQMPPLLAHPTLATITDEKPAISNKPATKTAGKKKRRKRVYKSRKVIPAVKNFVDYTEDDVLLGRGGLSNKHPGNKRYRQEIENAKAVYRSAAKEEKTEWASLLVEYVQRYGGRFLEKDKETGKWYIVPDIVARRKAGQALREENTPESRAEKRERYKKKLAMKT